MSAWTPPNAITHSGRRVDFSLFLYVIWDLHEWGYLTEWQYNETKFWIEQYQAGGAMPGTRLFACIWCGDEVMFTMMLDGLYLLHEAARDYDELPTTDEEARALEGTEIDMNVWFPHPVNVGRFGLLPLSAENAFDWVHMGGQEEI